TVGALWGVASGYLGGRFDLVSQRITEVLQSFPDLILAMAISMAIGTGMPAVIVAIAITRIPFGNPVIRSVALTIRELAYVEAALAAGGSSLRVMTRHVLPQCMAPYLVLATTHLGVAIIIEAALGFLGVGIPPPTPTWGNMLAESLTSLVPHWRLGFFPGLATTVRAVPTEAVPGGRRSRCPVRARWPHRGRGAPGASAASPGDSGFRGTSTSSRRRPSASGRSAAGIRNATRVTVARSRGALAPGRR